MKNDNTLATRDKKAISEILEMEDLVDVGTEEVSQEDLNTPILKIVQSTSQDLDLSQIGKLYRSDIKEYSSSVAVQLVCLITEENENYNKTGIEKVKVYYGFYKDSVSPFKLYIRGWSLGAHRFLQTEIQNIKHTYKVPMFALNITISTEKQEGNMTDSGKPYTTYKIRFDILKDEAGKPILETNKDRQGFLFEAAMRFKEISLQNESSKKSDIPF